MVESVEGCFVVGQAQMICLPRACWQ